MQQKIDTEEKICSFLEKKSVLFKRFLSLTQRMKAVLTHTQEGNLGRLIAQRQDCLHKIEKIDTSLKGFVPKGSDIRGYISGKLNRLVGFHLQTLRYIMELLEPLDREVMVLVKQERENIKTELLRQRNFRQAARGYNHSVRYPAKFLDTHR